MIYLSSTLSLAYYFYYKSQTLLRQTWLPILVLLTQPHNMILLPFHICLENVIKRLQFHSDELANVYNFFGWTLFFQLVCTSCLNNSHICTNSEFQKFFVSFFYLIFFHISLVTFDLQGLGQINCLVTLSIFFFSGWLKNICNILWAGRLDESVRIQRVLHYKWGEAGGGGERSPVK